MWEFMSIVLSVSLVGFINVVFFKPLLQVLSSCVCSYPFFCTHPLLLLAGYVRVVRGFLNYTSWFPMFYVPVLDSPTFLLVRHRDLVSSQAGLWSVVLMCPRLTTNA